MKNCPAYPRFSVIAALLLFAVSAQAQTISYMIPDIGAPGMNVYVELIAPHDAIGSFGTDGFHTNNAGDEVRVECVDPGDTALVQIGPLVVSWEGRMISTQIFIHPDARPPSSDWNVVGAAFEIPLRVVRNGTPSNSELFYIVQPQPAIITAASGREIGSGGTMGLRSRRGAMIVDSLVLTGDTYTVSKVDGDPGTAGNQGYLPAVILSRGPARFGPTTRVHVDAVGKMGGPGGGGGGGNFCDWSGDGTDGGDGFTGGGPGGRNRSGNPFGSDEYRNPGTGSGAFIGMTGGSLNGVRGGNAPAYEASGGGTGHPFGTSGEGCASGSGCNPPGGHGGGSGQQQTRPGGGGGYATAGGSSSNGNGGQVHGNMFVVPLAGGSGGASGNPQQGFACSGDGGGGGGALRLFATEVNAYLLTANGGGGGNGASGDGGSGSGGAIELQAKIGSGVWKIAAMGGTGAGTPGGAGRIRMDGPLGWYSSGLPVDESLAIGPSTDTSTFVRRSFDLTGTGNGEDIHLYLKSRSMPWTPLVTVSGYANAWSERITLPENGDSLFYIAALQDVPNPSSDRYAARPVRVLSQAAANILMLQTFPEIAGDDAITYPDMLCDDEAVDTVMIRNTGDGILILESATFLRGGQAFAILQPVSFPYPVPPGDSVAIVVRSRRIPGQTGLKTDSLVLRHNARNRNPFYIRLQHRIDEAALNADADVVNMPEILLCASSVADTVITVTNAGSRPLRILPPQFDDPAYAVVAPDPGVFPILLAPDSTLRLQVRVTHGSAGTVSGTLIVAADSTGCFVERRIDFTSRAWEPLVSLTDTEPYPALLCEGEFADDTLFIRNDGEEDVRIITLASSDAAFRVLTPTAPFTLARGTEVPVIIRFAPSAAGSYDAFAIVEAEPCGLRFERPLTGVREDVLVTADPLNFGLVRTENLPITATTMIRNAGTVPVTVSSSLDVPPFRIIGGLPVTIPPGGSAPVNVQFDDPSSDGTYGAQLALLHAPACDPVFLDVSGRRATARIALIADTLSAGPGTVVELRLFLKNAENLQLFGATGITANLRFEKSLLVPLDEPIGSIVGDERIVPLDLPLTTDANDVVMRVRFMVTLGTALQTPLLLTDVVPLGGDLTVDVTDGQFTLLDVCREGDPRLFDGAASVALAPNSPNPFNPVTTLRYSTIEAGPTQLYVIDALGRRVATLFHGTLQPGSHRAVFDGSTLPSGLYFAVLQTPTVVRIRRMLLAK